MKMYNGFRVLGIIFFLYIMMLPNYGGSRASLSAIMSFKCSTPLGESFKRLVTQNRTEYLRISPDNKHLFLNSRWTDKIHSGLLSGVLNAPNSGPNSSHRDFHTIIGERFLKNSQNSKFNLPQYLTLKKPSNFGKIVDYESLADSQKQNFVNGHFLALEGFTQFPKVLVNMFAQPSNSVNNPDQKKSHEWFLSLDQALICSTIGEYRETVALLKNFDAYSTFGITVIPPQAYVSFRVGLTAPQYLPALNKNVYDRAPSPIFSYKDFTEYCCSATEYIIGGMKMDEHSIWRFFERVEGGSTQFYFAYGYYDKLHRKPQDLGNDYSIIEPIKVFRVDNALYQRGKIFKPTYPSKVRVSHKNLPIKAWDKATITQTHFFDDDYDKLEIKLLNVLEDQGLITNDESNEIAGILTEMKK